MRVSLDKENRFITEDGCLDQKKAFLYSGVKAAWCYKAGTATPESIREMSEEDLLRMGITTFLDDHGTPDDHLQISVEITGIPKFLCMILNNEHDYNTCERSLRYTKVLPSDYISEIEVEKYNKWTKIIADILDSEYRDFFLKTNDNDEKKARVSMQKIAQENARQFVSVLTPTSIAYSARWYQWQKIANYLLYFIEHAETDLEKRIVPDAKELVRQLVDLKVVVLTEDAVRLYPPILEKISDDRRYLFRNNKGVKLSIFAKNDPFSGINKPNSFGSTINYNGELSMSSFAQAHRNRTLDWEIEIPDEFSFFIPPIIKDTEYEQDYIEDMLMVKNYYPQGKMIKVNLNGSLKNIITYMGQERACDKAQQEIENWYVNKLLPDIVNGLVGKAEYLEEYKMLTKSYLNRCRCSYPTYHCPKTCGHPRTIRPF